MILEKGWHYIAVKKLPALLRGVTSTHNGYCYCLSCFHSFRKNTNLNLIKNYVKINILVTL